MRTNTNDLCGTLPAGAAPVPVPWRADWPAADAGPGSDAAGDAQQLRIDITPVEQILRKTRSVALGRHRCPADHPQFQLGGGPHTCAYIAFHRTSVRMKIGDSRPEVATPNHVSFYNVGESYSREAIGAEGDECDWLALSPETLRDVHTQLAEHEAAGGRLFPRAFAPMKPETFFAQRKLFSAARTEFKHMASFYFHNFIYEGVWKDNMRRWSERTSVWDIIHKYGPDYRVIFVGDATMSPYEILSVGGSVEHFNEEPGAAWMQRLRHHFQKSIWLNPEHERVWSGTQSISQVRQLMEQQMYPLTLKGIEEGMRYLSR